MQHDDLMVVCSKNMMSLQSKIPSQHCAARLDRLYTEKMQWIYVVRFYQCPVQQDYKMNKSGKIA
jgi:hypothetical protein